MLKSRSPDRRPAHGGQRTRVRWRFNCGLLRRQNRRICCSFKPTSTRECLDHVIVLSEASLRRILVSYFASYHDWRTHLSLDKDAPESRPIQPSQQGPVVEFPAVGGLHLHYERRVA
jgi:hypothetical protein